MQNKLVEHWKAIMKKCFFLVVCALGSLFFSVHANELSATDKHYNVDKPHKKSSWKSIVGGLGMTCLFGYIAFQFFNKCNKVKGEFSREDFSLKEFTLNRRYFEPRGAHLERVIGLFGCSCLTLASAHYTLKNTQELLTTGEKPNK